MKSNYLRSMFNHSMIVYRPQDKAAASFSELSLVDGARSATAMCTAAIK